MNWGHKIIIVFVVFAAGILTLVTKSMRTKIDMVTPDYYGEELKYQQVIDGKENVNRLSAPVAIAQQSAGVLITLPPELHDKHITGKLTFYRPSDSGRDIALPLQPDPAGQQLINRQLFIKGQYKVKLTWTMNEQPYYQEQLLNIN
ncbi:FixH family protein [Chitinophaga arvensicola]|uniref:FixH protein n=1 Tax=Chitinophaga arvensicola TaxID=29529 RepID=A0A1I0PDD0_9BACT|nr:FixH family protein [Chitinophaga arvensicola]SEW12207.1 FixH protein [Chitinophaga arvensicola]